MQKTKNKEKTVNLSTIIGVFYACQVPDANQNRRLHFECLSFGQTLSMLVPGGFVK